MLDFVVGSQASATPLLSVVMAVKDGGIFLQKAIDSILQQTFRNFELIVIDDGSTDNTWQILESYRDPRIRIVKQENQGVSRASNRGLAMARGKYITRHDHDDMSLPTRFAQQVEHLQTHPQCAYVGTRAHIWMGDTSTLRTHDHPMSPGMLAFALLFDSPFVLSSCMFRREVLDTIGMYATESCRIPMEDFEFVSRVARYFELANLPEYLLIYRETPYSESSALRLPDNQKAQLILSRISLFSAENLAFACGRKNPSVEDHDFGALCHWYFAGVSPKPNYVRIRASVKDAATRIAQRFSEPEVLLLAKAKLSELDYQYYTYMGQTWQWQRLIYILRTRSLIQLWASLKKRILP